MSENRIFRVFQRVVDIQRGELPIAFLFFWYFFLITAPYNIIKSIRNATLLDKMGYRGLPLAYLLTAVITGLVVALHSKLHARLPRYRLMTATLVVFFATCFLFQSLAAQEWIGIPVLYWVWANLFIMVLVTQFWILVNSILNPREFKRLIGFIASGGILGGIVGAEIAGWLAKSSVDYNLLFLASGMLVLEILLTYFIFLWKRKASVSEPAGKQPRDADARGLLKVGFKDSFDTVRKHAYLRLIAGIVVVTMVVSTLVDFQFNTIVDAQERLSQSLTSFFGHFNAGVMVVAFFLQLLMTSGLMKRYGIRVALLLYPLVLLVFSLGIAAVISIVLAILLKGSDKSLSYSIHQSARELLYVPVSPERKYRAMVFIDMFVNRFSKAIASVVILVILFFVLGGTDGIIGFEQELSAGMTENIVRVVAGVSLALIIGWVILNQRVSREYVHTVKRKLAEKRERAEGKIEKEIDVDAAKLIFDMLDSMGRSSDLYAMHLFDLIEKGKLTPELRRLIAAKSREATLASVKPILDEDTSHIFVPDQEEVDEESLKKEIKEIFQLDVYQDVMKGYAESLLAAKDKDTELARTELAKGLGFLDPSSPLTEKLEELVEDPSPEVCRYAAESMGRLRRREFVPALVRMLQDPKIRGDAVEALEKYGDKITGTLADYLGDAGQDPEVRSALASLLARICSPETAHILIRQLEEDRTPRDSELIDALDKIRAEKPDLRISVPVVKRTLRRKIQEYSSLFLEFTKAESQGGKEAFCIRFSEKCRQSLAEIFKLLGLIYPHEDITRAFQNLEGGTKESVAYAVELLDNILDKELRDALIPVVEDRPREEKIRACLALKKKVPEF